MGRQKSPPNRKGKRGHTRKGKTPFSPDVVNSALNQHQALRLRCAHLTFQQIADQLKVEVSTAHGYVKTALTEVRTAIFDDAEELRALMLSQLDEAHRVWWPRALGIPRKVLAPGEYPPEPDPKALDRILRIMDRKMALLGFLEVPPAPDNSDAMNAMRDKAEVYAEMGVQALTRMFMEKIKSPVVINGEVKQIETAAPVPAQPEAQAGR